MSVWCRLLGPRPVVSDWIREHSDNGAVVWKSMTVCLRCGEMQWAHTVIGPLGKPLRNVPDKQVLGCWR